MSLLQGRVDCIADRADLKFNLLSGESQNSNSLFHHPLITNRVLPLAQETKASPSRAAGLRHYQRLATSAFMNARPSVANCFSLSYIFRQIFVAGTSFSRANPKASMTIAPS